MSLYKIHWTTHSQIKMKQYGLSKLKLLGIMRKPERKEQGIAPGTTAVMQTRKVFGNKERKVPPGEIWLMYKDTKIERSIISAWRYPGISKPGESIPIPEDIKRELIQSL